MPSEEVATKENLSLAVNSSSLLPSLAPLIKSNVTGNDAGSSIPTPEYLKTIIIVVWIFSLLLGLFGMATNGAVIWTVGHMRRNSFTTYILNLSIADFGLLTTVVFEDIYMLLWLIHKRLLLDVLMRLLSTLFFFAFSASQFLLAAISIDRCICLFFPLWHKCCRPPHLSNIICVTIWSLAFSFSAVDFTLAMSIGFDDLRYYQVLLNIALCMPAMAISGIAMLIKVCFFSRHHQWKKFLKAILFALLFFLFFGFPMNISLLPIYKDKALLYVTTYTDLSAVLNSAVNPLIYFLVGRDKKAPSRKSIKKILAKLFQEEEDSSKEEDESSVEKHVIP